MGKKKRLRRERQETWLAEVETRSTGQPGFQLKMDRAGLHIKNLDLAVQEWLEAHSDLVQEETEPETGDDVVFVDAPGVAPADSVSLIAADCVHNLRASLDQIVFSLSWACTGGPLPNEVVQGCEFPIFGPRAPKKPELEKRIGAIHPDARSIIKDLQPHHAGDAFTEEKLWILDQLWNMDKHRTLPLTVFGQQAIEMTPQALTGTATFRVQGPIRRKTEIIRFAGGRPESYPDPKRAVHLDIAFGKGTPAYGHPVVSFLSELADYLRDEVIGKLTPFLD
ncbi:MAG: hypothetical protein ACJ75T_07270 [Solirubrobacterales bacterium]